MIVCGERLIIDKENPENSEWRFCILDKDHREDHKFEKKSYTEQKRKTILILATKTNRHVPEWFNRNHYEFEQWTRDQQVTFGIKFLTIASNLKWSPLKKLAFLYDISQSIHYVNDVMELNDTMNDMAIAMAIQAKKDPLFAKRLREETKEAELKELQKVMKN